jgi:hypothetical protein
VGLGSTGGLFSGPLASSLAVRSVRRPLGEVARMTEIRPSITLITHRLLRRIVIDAAKDGIRSPATGEEVVRVAVCRLSPAFAWLARTLLALIVFHSVTGGIVCATLHVIGFSLRHFVLWISR